VQPQAVVQGKALREAGLVKTSSDDVLGGYRVQDKN